MHQNSTIITLAGRQVSSGSSEFQAQNLTIIVLAVTTISFKNFDTNPVYMRPPPHPRSQDQKFQKYAFSLCRKLRTRLLYYSSSLLEWTFLPQCGHFNITVEDRHPSP